MLIRSGISIPTPLNTRGGAIDSMPAKTMRAGVSTIFFATSDLIEKNIIKDAFILNDVLGSDHCPVGIELDFDS